jgi:hypothetical protein
MMMIYAFKYNNEDNRLCPEESSDLGRHLGLRQVVNLHSLLHTHFYGIVSKVFHITVNSPRRQEGRGARRMRIRSKRKERKERGRTEPSKDTGRRPSRLTDEHGQVGVCLLECRVGGLDELSACSSSGVNRTWRRRRHEHTSHMNPSRGVKVEASAPCPFRSRPSLG